MGTWDSFAGVKPHGREADHSPPSSTEVKNGRAIPPLHIRLQGVVLKHRNNSTFTFYWLQFNQNGCIICFETFYPNCTSHKNQTLCVQMTKSANLVERVVVWYEFSQLSHLMDFKRMWWWTGPSECSCGTAIAGFVCQL
jgi:hypothetical protein